ncbi:MAG: 30S ribosomal protein S17 [Pseudomonadota bacterium]
MTERGSRKVLVGRVISDKMAKTIVVETASHVAHAKYHKTLVRKAKFYAHDEKEQAGFGDMVKIRESRPLSRLKRWTLVEVVRSVQVLEGDEVRREKSRKKKEETDAAQAAKTEAGGAS